MKKIRKAVIPAAGMGTRFLPATKSLPKEMLPIVDIPNIHFIVEEAVKAGIESILIITSGTKKAIEDYFDYDYELEKRLIASGKEKEAEEVHKIGDMADVFFVRQKEPKGLGHAILCAKDFVGDEPFAILLGDDLVVPDNDGEPAIKSLIDAYYETGKSIVGVKKVEHKEIYKYASVKPHKEVNEGEKVFLLDNMIEKPALDEAYSDYAVLGRYVGSPELIKVLEHTLPGKNNEIQLTDALKELCLNDQVYANIFPGTRYDIGDKFGYIKAILDYSLTRDDLKEKVEEYLRKLTKII